MDMDREMEVQEKNTVEEMEKQGNKPTDETIEGNNATPPTEAKQEIPFKKPTVLIGKIGRLPKKVLVSTSTSPSGSKQETTCEEKPANIDGALQNKVVTNLDAKSLHSSDSPEDQPAQQQLEGKQAPAQEVAESSSSIPYKEPNWSGLPETTGKPYALEVLKNGRIIQTIDLMKKPFWAFGRLLNSDISAQHPTISRYHAVIQYRDIPSETEPPGFYVYDLGSTHGTFLNGKNNKLKPKMYAPIRVGHMLRFGLSQRSYILTGPEDDQEEESELSVTELKQLREQKIKEHKEKMKQAELEREEKRKKEEDRGVDWGMGDDADDNDEEMGENPYASTNNEELYLDDPKKALRGFFEREGLELDYNCTEQGMGQFLCKVELPVDDEMGRPIVAEVLHRGKKKEAVVQCALEACRVLDRFGVLRQATHESRKRKAKNWEENDYYDSDEDTFLDRTGTIEKKREKRMKVRETKNVETYESLLAKEREITSSITKIEQRLYLAQENQAGASSSTQSEEDSLDSYMNKLGNDKLDKQAISKLKLELADLKKSLTNLIKLANIAKPANLPALVTPSSTSTSNAGNSKRALPLFGKRRKVPVKFPAKPSESTITQTANEDGEEESEEEHEEAKEALGTEESSTSHIDAPRQDNEVEHFNETSIATSSSSNNVSKEKILAKETHTGAMESPSSHVDEPTEDNEREISIASSSSSNNLSKKEILLSEADSAPIETISSSSVNLENVNYAIFAATAEKHIQKILKILHKLKKCNTTELKLDFHFETVKIKKAEILKLLEQLRVQDDAKVKDKVAVELYRVLNDLGEMMQECSDIGSITRDLESFFMELNLDIDALKNNYHQSIMEFNAQQKINIESNEKEQIKNEEVCKKKSVEQSQEINKKKLNKDEDNTDKDSPKKSEHSQMNSEDNSEETDEKKRKKNQKRTEQRQYKAEMEKLKGYQEDATKEDYNMWVPPIDQSGDGRTDLNDKYGY